MSDGDKRNFQFETSNPMNLSKTDHKDASKEDRMGAESMPLPNKIQRPPIDIELAQTQKTVPQNIVTKKSIYGDETIMETGKILAEDLKNLNFRRFCYDLYCVSLFWVLVSACAITEPVLCSLRKPDSTVGINYGLQCLVLALSTSLLVFQVIANMYILEEYDERWIVKKQGVDKDSSSFKSFQLQLLMCFEVCTTGSIFLECVCILGGWICIYYHPGISALRCFRVLRILYFHQLPRQILYKIEKLWYISPFGMVCEFHLVERACKFASQCLTNLTQEMFFLTSKTRGGFVLMFLLFYTAFVVGMAIFLEVYGDKNIISDPTDPTQCTSVFYCTVLMLRLTFYDGNGLNFITLLSHEYEFLFAVAIIYMCATAFGIFNGLIGVFGAIFNNEAERQFVLETDIKNLIFGYKLDESISRGHNKAREYSSTSVPRHDWTLAVNDTVIFRSTFSGDTTYGLAGEWDGRVAIVVNMVESRRYPALVGEGEDPQSRSRASERIFDLDKPGVRGITYTLHFMHKAGAYAEHRFRIETVREKGAPIVEGEEEEVGDMVNAKPQRTILHVLHGKRAKQEETTKIFDEVHFQCLMGTLEKVPAALQSIVERRVEDVEGSVKSTEGRLESLEARMRSIDGKLDELLQLLRK